MSQNVTLSPKDKADIEKIKLMLLERKTQEEMAKELSLRRETVNRKIRRWVQTEDFETWLKTAWLERYAKVDDAKAFEALTQLVGKMLTRKIEKKEQIAIAEKFEIDLNVFNDDEKSILDRAARILEQKSQRKSDSFH